MEEKFEFDAIIKSIEDIEGAYVDIPFDVESAFGKKRVPVHATFDGVPYDGSLVQIGMPNYIIGIRKDVRKKIGKQIGDTVHVVLRKR